MRFIKKYIFQLYKLQVKKDRLGGQSFIHIAHSLEIS